MDTIINEIKMFIYDENGVLIKYRVSEKYIFKNHRNTLNIIKTQFPDLPFKVALYCFVNKISQIPQCPICGKEITLDGRFNFSNGFRKYCTKECAMIFLHNSKEIQDKIKKTNIIKYGSESPFGSIEIRKKIEENNFEKYGVKYLMQSNIVQDKFLKIKEEKYNNKNYNNSEKRKITNLIKYGFEDSFMNENVKNKIKETNLIKYNNEYAIASNPIREKIIQTNLEKYGVESTLLLDDIWEKIKKTNLEKYDVEYPLQSSKIHEKIIQTNLIKYGVKNIGELESIINKINIKKNEVRINKLSKQLSIPIANLLIEGDVITIKQYCNLHDEFKISKNIYYNRLNRDNIHICTKCNPIGSQDSNNEKELFEFVNTLLNIDIIRNDRKILDGKEIDILFPNNKIGIEFNGEYWHSNIFLDSNYHKNKKDLAEEKNIDLYFIWNSDFIRKRNIVESIIKSKFNKFDFHINGGDCEMCEIDIDDSNLFNSINSLGEIKSSSYRIGLKYDNDLVLLMCIDYITENIYVINGISSRLHTKVIDGEMVLLKYFHENYSPEKIIMSLNRDINNGKFLDELGFVHLKNTEPDYFYFSDYKFSSKIDDILNKNNIYKIFNSGNMLYELNFKKI